jgi:hypothetical protein
MSSTDDRTELQQPVACALVIFVVVELEKATRRRVGAQEESL